MIVVFAKIVGWLASEICGECMKLALHWLFRHSMAGEKSMRLDNLVATNSSLHATLTSLFKFPQVLVNFFLLVVEVVVKLESVLSVQGCTSITYTLNKNDLQHKFLPKNSEQISLLSHHPRYCSWVYMSLQFI